MEATSSDLKDPQDKTVFTVLVTGANSGLGFAICCRLIDEFTYTRPQSQTLHLLFSTRDAQKSADTLQRLRAHFQRTLRRADGTTPGISLLLEGRVRLEGVQVDLLRLTTCKALAEQLLRRGRRLDAVVWNAGIPGWSGLDWPRAIRDILTGPKHNSTYPTYPICVVGARARPQLPPPTPTTTGGEEPPPEPVLGEVFTANVFGHYMLTHWLAPLFHPGSRIVWIGSISAVAEAFSADDVQGLRAPMAYESSKRLTDHLVLTSDLPSTQLHVRTFLAAAAAAAASDADSSPRPPRMYLAHPGVIGTSIAALPWLLELAMLAFFHLARLLGSPWHGVAPYKGAVAAVWAVLAPPDQIVAAEEREGKGKWGSAVSVRGAERVARTETEGWGYGGVGVGTVVPPPPPPGSVASTWKRRQPLTREAREEFEVVGRRVWAELEELRVEFERRLGPIAQEASSVDM